MMNNWTLAYDSFEPAEERLREALTSTGNGYFCTRGAFSWTEADEDVHYPATYMHGGYNRETTIMAGVPVLNEDLVNLPNWLLFELRIEGEEAVGIDNVVEFNDATIADSWRVSLLHEVGVGGTAGSGRAGVY
jgi:trehalose/maltose hydrolase-like predicted phosphorylase